LLITGVHDSQSKSLEKIWFEMPHPIVQQFGYIPKLDKLTIVWEPAWVTVRNQLFPTHIITNQDQDSELYMESRSIYILMSSYSDKHDKKEDVVEFRTSFLELQQDLKEYAKCIKTTKAKQYLGDCCHILERLNIYLASFTRIRRFIEDQLRSASRFTITDIEAARSAYVNAAKNIRKEIVKTDTFADLNITDIAAAATVDARFFTRTYQAIENSLEMKFAEDLPKPREEREKYLLNLISLLPDILRYVGMSSRNRIAELSYFQLFNKNIIDEMKREITERMEEYKRTTHWNEETRAAEAYEWYCKLSSPEWNKEIERRLGNAQHFVSTSRHEDEFSTYVSWGDIGEQ